MPRIHHQAVYCCVLLWWALLSTMHVHAQVAETTQLPVIFIDTDGAAIVDEPKVGAYMWIADAPSGLNYLQRERNSSFTYDGYAGIELRGRSSQTFAKKSFGLETRNADGSNNNTEVLGFPAENDWVLHGPYADRSLLRNALAYQLASQLGVPAPRARLSELYINDDYRGVYLFTEKVKRDANRVALDRPRGNAARVGPSTDFLIEINHVLDDPSEGWIGEEPTVPGTEFYTHYRYVYPKQDEITAREADYLAAWVTDLERLLASSSFDDPNSGYAAEMDVDAFVDYIIFQEITRDVDAYFGSTFLIKDAEDKGGRLRPGPVWDHDLAFGNSDYCADTLVQGLAIVANEVCRYRIAPVLFGRLWADSSFRTRVASRYFGWRFRELGPDLFQLMDSLVAQVSVAAQRNYARWPIEGQYVWPNAYVGEDWEADVRYLNRWLTKRLAYLDSVLWKYVPLPVAGNPVVNVYPNPIAGTGRALVSIGEGIDRASATASVLDVQGRVIQSLALPLDELPVFLDLEFPGTYWLSVRDETGSQGITQFIYAP